MEKLLSLIKYLLPMYEKEGKNKIVLAFGCTGGKHRSVYSALKIGKELMKNNKYNVTIEHRDIKNE